MGLGMLTSQPSPKKRIHSRIWKITCGSHVCLSEAFHSAAAMRMRSGPGTPSSANSFIRFFMTAQYWDCFSVNLRCFFPFVDVFVPEGSSLVNTASKRACK